MKLRKDMMPTTRLIDAINKYNLIQYNEEFLNYSEYLGIAEYMVYFDSEVAAQGLFATCVDAYTRGLSPRMAAIVNLSAIINALQNIDSTETVQ